MLTQIMFEQGQRTTRSLQSLADWGQSRRCPFGALQRQSPVRKVLHTWWDCGLGIINYKRRRSQDTAWLWTSRAFSNGCLVLGIPDACKMVSTPGCRATTQSYTQTSGKTVIRRSRMRSGNKPLGHPWRWFYGMNSFARTRNTHEFHKSWLSEPNHSLTFPRPEAGRVGLLYAMFWRIW